MPQRSFPHDWPIKGRDEADLDTILGEITGTGLSPAHETEERAAVPEFPLPGAVEAAIVGRTGQHS